MDPTNNPSQPTCTTAPDGDERINSVTGERPTLSELRRSVGELTRILYVRRWLFFAPVCIVMTASFLMSLRVPRQYQATTTFERRDDPVLVNLPRNEGSGAFATFRRTLEQDIANAESLIAVVRELDLIHHDTDDDDTPDPTPTDADVRRMARRLASGLQVHVLQESEHLDVIQIRYTAENPHQLRTILDRVRDAYITTTQLRITELLTQTKRWFENEHKKRRAVVEQLEDDLIRFRTEHQGLDPLDPNSSSDKLRELRAELIALEHRGTELKTQIDGRKRFIQGGTAAAPGRVPANLAAELGITPAPPDPEARRRAQEIRRLSAKIEDLKTVRGMTDRHPEVAALLRKRDNLADAFDQQYGEDPAGLSVNGVTDVDDDAAKLSPGDDPLLADRARAEMEVEIFQKLLTNNREAVARKTVTIKEYEEYQHDAFVHRKEFTSRIADVDRARRELALYQGYADQVGRVLAAENSQRGILFGRVSPARGGVRPISPRSSTIVVLALTIGLTTGIVLVLVSEVFDRTVRTRRQVTDGLGLQILESVGEIISIADRRRRMFTRLCLVPAVVLILVSMVGLSGSLAYLSLNHREWYERAITAPRSALMRLVHATRNWQPATDGVADHTERRG